MNRIETIAHGTRKLEFDMRVPVPTIVTILASLLTVIWMVSAFKATQEHLNTSFERRLSKLEDFVDGVKDGLELIRTDIAVLKVTAVTLSNDVASLDAKIDQLLAVIGGSSGNEGSR